MGHDGVADIEFADVDDGGNGLRARLLGQVDPNLLNRLAGWAGFLSRAEVDEPS